MKLKLLLFLTLTLSAFGQTVSTIGQVTSFGSIFTLTPILVALPDAALLSWDTTVSATPSPGSVITIGNPGAAVCGLTTATPGTCSFTPSQLNTAVGSLTCGQVLDMQNTVYPIGNFTMTQHCTISNWITVQNDPTDTTFPAEGTLVTPCYIGLPSSALAGLPSYVCSSPARHMPLIQKTGGGSTISIFCQFCRFKGIDWGRVNTYDLDFGMILMVNSAACSAPDNACIAAQPNHVIFDRNIIHGDAQRQTTRAITLGGCQWCAVIDSYLYDFMLSFQGGGGDSQVLAWGNGKNITNVGWGKFVNDFESASTMGFLTGGAFTEPVSPSTGFDGVPHDIWFSQQFFYKNPLWNAQMGQSLNENLTIEGVTYPHAADQEFFQYPAAIQLAVGQAYQVQTWSANDSTSGVNHSTAVISSSNTLTCNGVVTASGGICGTVTTSFTNVGSGNHFSQGQFVTTYTAPASIPPGTTVLYTRNYTVGDNRSGTNFLKQNRVLTASTVFTIVTSNPVHQLAVGPAAADLQIQPSYPGPGQTDAFGNARQFCLSFNAIPNFTSTSTTWQVDNVTAGNTSVGTIDTQGLYCSSATPGTYTIKAIASDGTFSTSPITVSNTAQILAFDGKIFTSKNGWELKEALRVLFENSLIANGWGSNGNGGGQGGQFILTHPLNQIGCTGNTVVSGVTFPDANKGNCLDGNGVFTGTGTCSTDATTGVMTCASPNTGWGPQIVADLTIRNIKGMHFGAGFVVGAGSNSLGFHRGSITNVLCDDCNYLRWSNAFGSTYFETQTNGGPSTVYAWESVTNPMNDNISYRHITSVGAVPNTFGINADVAQPKMINYVMQDSFFTSPNSITFLNPNGGNTNCDIASGTGANNTEARALVPCFANYTFNHLALLDSTAAANVFLSSPIWQPAATAVGFVNYNGGNGGDYRLCTGVNIPDVSCTGASLYAAGQSRQASDGNNMGADMTLVNAAETLVRSGVRTP